MQPARAALGILGLLLVALLALTPPAGATPQDDKNPFGSLGTVGSGSQAGGGGSDFGDSRDVVGLTFRLQRESAPPGAVVPAAVILDIEPGWHIWTDESTTLEGTVEFDGAIRTVLSTSELVGLTTGGVEWPEPHSVSADLGYGPQDYAVFEGRAVILVDLIVDADAAPGSEASARIALEFQACDDATCLMPTFDPPHGTVRLKVDPAQPATIPAEGVFEGWTPKAAPSGTGTANTAGATDGTKPADVAPAPAEGASGSTFFGVSVPKGQGAIGLVLLILMGVAGGFVLNLTPCVLPVIPIKIMTISQHAGTSGRALSLGLWMALGVFAFWFLIGLPVAFLTTFTDPSALFGIWWVTLGIGLLIGVMGIGIMGLFSFQLPQSVYMVNPKADNAGGSFLFGVMTAVLGLPCFGFVAGALLAGTAALPAYVTLLIFGSIGVGMALPYLVLSARPSLVERIPRTGPASELVKQVMGLLLIAAAAYFVGSGLIGLTAEMPWMGKQIHWWAIAFAMIVAGFWLCVRTFQITSGWGARIVWTAVAIVFAFVPTWYAVLASEKAHETWVALASVRDGGSTGYSTSVWNPYTPERLAAARNDGKTVIVDFTAEWCLNCKALKAAVLDKDPVRSRIADDPDVVAFTADNTSRNAPGWKLMEELGQTGIPLLAIWGPEDEKLAPWQSNAYTSGQVMEALDQREP